MISDKLNSLLSKSRYMGGLQCLKRIFLQSNFPEFADPIDDSMQALFDSGTAVGELARGLYPGGILVIEPAYNHNAAVEKTNTLLSDRATPAIFEAAFTFDGIRTRIDVLERQNTGTFALNEVKSSTKVKAEHIPDIAVQVYVAEGSGLSVTSAYLVHINGEYVYDGESYELKRLFRSEDVTEEVRSYLSDRLPDDLSKMKDILSFDSAPAVDIGSHCNLPYKCPFFAHCREGMPDHHIEQLPGVRAPLLQSLKSAGIDDIRDIPAGFKGLSSLHERVRECVVGETSYVGPELDVLHSQLEYPLRFLDFETFNPGLPLYPGTSPYQVIPFQWSMHRQDSDGNVDHEAFLYEGPGDPRPRFVESLLENVGSIGSIFIYSNYEPMILRGLSREFRDYADALLGLCDRMFDLLKTIRSHYYHPGLHGSFSLKAVLPVLVPDLGYNDLRIANGSNASLAYATMISPGTAEPEKDRLNSALLAYCNRDTEAMVRIYEALTSGQISRSH